MPRKGVETVCKGVFLFRFSILTDKEADMIVYGNAKDSGKNRIDVFSLEMIL